MAEETKDLTARQRIEQAVTKVGRAYDDLVRTVEKNGDDLTKDDLEKVFKFLNQVHLGSQNKAQLSLATAIAANGGFSLDKDYDLTPATEIVGQNGPIRLSPEEIEQMKQLEGRLVGQRRRKKRDPLDDPEASDFLEE